LAVLKTEPPAVRGYSKAFVRLGQACGMPVGRRGEDFFGFFGALKRDFFGVHTKKVAAAVMANALKSAPVPG
jgi:hypothetical protein